MSKIHYLCWDCISELGEKLKSPYRLKAVNEVGRKFCVHCGNNDNNLFIFDEKELEGLINYE